MKAGIALAAGGVLVGAWFGLSRPAAKPPPRLGQVPAFEFTAATAKGGRPFASSELAGRAWVADFIFTSCSGPCPTLSLGMAGLQLRLPPDVRLVSFSVDPERDSPAVLARYAERFGADPGRWVFLTGKKSGLRRLLKEGFRLPVGEDPNADPGERIAHSARFVLVDGGGSVRGFYDGQDPADVRRLEEDARSLKD